MKFEDKQLTFEELISSNDPEEFLESTIPFQKIDDAVQVCNAGSTD